MKRPEKQPPPPVATTTGDPLLGLTPKQKAFVDHLLDGANQTLAARLAGYSNAGVEAVRMMKNPKVLEALQYQHRKYEKAMQITRKQVMEGMLEAIDMARLQADSNVMVNGWREIGRMCGYYAAEKKVIDINVTAKRAVDKLEALSDAELLELIAEDSEAIEGEYAEVLEQTQELADEQHAAAGRDW